MDWITGALIFGALCALMGGAWTISRQLDRALQLLSEIERHLRIKSVNPD